MIKRKRIISILVSMLVLVGNIQPITARANEESSTYEAEFRAEGNYIIDSEGKKYYGFVDGMGQEVSINAALEILNSDICTQDDNIQNENISRSENVETRGIVPVLNPVSISSYNDRYVGAARKVTPDLQGGNISLTLSQGVSYSFTGTLEVGAENVIMNFIQVNMSVSLTMETTQTAEVQFSFDVPTGETGAIYFKPYYRKAVGQYDDGSNTRAFTAQYPRLLTTGFADGLYYLSTW